MAILLQADAPSFPFDADTAARYRAEYAASSGLPVEVANSLGMKLALVPPGRFERGPNGSRYRVALSKPYQLGTVEGTLGRKRRPERAGIGGA